MIKKTIYTAALILGVIGIIASCSNNKDKNKRHYSRHSVFNRQEKIIRNNFEVVEQSSPVAANEIANYNDMHNDMHNNMSSMPKKKPYRTHSGHMIKDDVITSGYNETAKINVNGVKMYLSAAFIYWQGKQDGLALGEDSITVSQINTRNTVRMDFDYEPGFKVGIGGYFKHDNWTLFADYTRIHETSSRSWTAASGHNLIPHWFITSDTGITSSRASWKYEYDMITGNLGRPYYVGKRLVFLPGFGLKGGWLDQKYDITYTSTTATRTNNVKTTSWLVGPRLLFNTDWHLGCDFRFLANLNASLFYQKYKKIAARLNDPSDSTAPNKNFSDNKEGFLRPNLSGLLGLGWGRYFIRQKMHFDIFAAYEIDYYWNQNMMANLIDRNVNSNSFIAAMESIGDFSLHGLTINVRFDF